MNDKLKWVQGAVIRYKMEPAIRYKKKSSIRSIALFSANFLGKGPLLSTVEDYRMYKIKAEQSCVGFGLKILVNRFYHEKCFSRRVPL